MSSWLGWPLLPRQLLEQLELDWKRQKQSGQARIATDNISAPKKYGNSGKKNKQRNKARRSDRIVLFF
ncbi:hypothetical protein RWE15_15360 [Virgibacillus halophilus]|uniref:Uncharacterized protein n=1 Tax=Tigheibacillus halophilus TaxID=361280 RepID=A0ABU5C8D7_9BACI|nr:hypothetical protein [Virgibacillus halophilus]